MLGNHETGVDSVLHCFFSLILASSPLHTSFHFFLGWNKSVLKLFPFSTVSLSEHTFSFQGFLCCLVRAQSQRYIVCTVGLYERSSSVKDRWNCWPAIRDNGKKPVSVLTGLHLYILTVTRFLDTDAWNRILHSSKNLHFWRYIGSLFTSCPTFSLKSTTALNFSSWPLYCPRCMLCFPHLLHLCSQTWIASPRSIEIYIFTH